jgi:predicted MFS family arabinose efflux permease
MCEQFGVEYAQSGYHLSRSSAVGMLALLGIGALAGIWVGGKLGDSLLAKGHLRARVWVSTAFFCAAVTFFFFGFFFPILWLSIVLFICSSFSLGAINPPLDAARLDIIHPKLWGRAESVRMIFRDATEAAAPITFSMLATGFGGERAGLRDAFLIMLIPLGIAAGLAFITFRTYPPDAAAAMVYRHKTIDGSDEK